MNIPHEVNNPFEGLLLLYNANVFLKSTARVIGECADDAALLRTISFVVDVAAFWRIVQGVDVVIYGRETTARFVPITVCPSSDVGQIGRRGVVQQSLCKFGSLVADKVLGKVGDGSMSKGAPGVDIAW